MVFLVLWTSLRVKKKQTNKKNNPHANMLMLITGTEVGGLHGKKNVHGGGSARTPPRGMHKRGWGGGGDLLRAIMTVITSGLTLTCPSWLSDWLGWRRDVNRSASLMLWLGLNYTPSVCFHQRRGRRGKSVCVCGRGGWLRKRGPTQKREGYLEKWGDKGGVTARVGGEWAYLLNI